MLVVQLSDLHVRPRGQPAMRNCETNMMTERALRAVRDFHPRPDALVITGDLAHNGEVAEYRNLAEMLARLIDLPVYVIPGNHDNRTHFRQELGHLPGVTNEPDFVHYAVEDLPVRLVLLDTLIPGSPEGELCPHRLEWLHVALTLYPDKPTIIAMHHPPFRCGIRHMDRLILRDPAGFAAVLSRHRQVQRVICGHHHRTITASLGHAIASTAPSVAHSVDLDLFSDHPGLWTLEPPGFQLHAWIDGSGIVSHTAFVERYPGPFPFVPDQK